MRALGLEDVQEKLYEIIYCIARVLKSEMSEGRKKEEEKYKENHWLQIMEGKVLAHQTGLQY